MIVNDVVLSVAGMTCLTPAARTSPVGAAIATRGRQRTKRQMKNR